MDEYARMMDAETLEFRRRLAGSRETVWQYLVDPEKRKLWFCGGETADKAGGAIVFDFDHTRLSERGPPAEHEGSEKVRFEGEVLIYDPPARLRFSWPEEDGAGTEVDIVLDEAGDGMTELKLRHTRLVKADYRKGAMAGWHAHVDLLEDLLAGRERRDFWETYVPLEAHYAELV